MSPQHPGNSLCQLLSQCSSLSSGYPAKTTLLVTTFSHPFFAEHGAYIMTFALSSLRSSFSPSTQHWSGVCAPGTSSSFEKNVTELLRVFNALALCPVTLERVDTLGEAVRDRVVDEGSHISDDKLLSVPETWIHELLHWMPEVRYAPFEDSYIVKLH